LTKDLFDAEARAGFHSLICPGSDTIVIADGKGNIAAASRTWPAPPVNIVDRDYFRFIKQNPDLNEYVSVPTLNRVDGLITVFVARRRRAEKGEFLGVVLAGMKLSDLEEFQRAATHCELHSSENTETGSIPQIPPRKA
jgi:hypothetical protein